MFDDLFLYILWNARFSLTVWGALQKKLTILADMSAKAFSPPLPKCTDKQKCKLSLFIKKIRFFKQESSENSNGHV